MMRNIAILLGVLVVIAIGVIAMQPSTFSIERSTEIAAPPEVIFPHLDSAKAMDVWSPFVKMDPNQALTHEGPERGIGSAESWDGPQAGAGRLEITAVKPNEEVQIRLDFTKPMRATNRATFTLTPAAEATRVAWRMDGENNFIGKAASLVMDMDEMVGSQFEKGLADLKELAESDAKARAEQAAAAQAAEGGTPMSFEEMKAAIGEAPGEPPADPSELATPPAEE
jgi:uncharacterized protein YndB with AHSA1/START domain